MADPIERKDNVSVIRGADGVFVAVDVNRNGTKLDKSDVAIVWTNKGRQVGQNGDGSCAIDTFNGVSPQRLSNEELGNMAANIAGVVCAAPRRR